MPMTAITNFTVKLQGLHVLVGEIHIMHIIPCSITRWCSHSIKILRGYILLQDQTVT